MKTTDVYIEVTARVRYWYAPAEPMTRDYPGAPEEIETETITGLVVDGKLYPIPDDLARALLDSDRTNIEAACIDAEVEALERSEAVWLDREIEKIRLRHRIELPQ